MVVERGAASLSLRGSCRRCVGQTAQLFEPSWLGHQVDDLGIGEGPGTAGVVEQGRLRPARRARERLDYGTDARVRLGYPALHGLDDISERLSEDLLEAFLRGCLQEASTLAWRKIRRSPAYPTGRQCPSAPRSANDPANTISYAFSGFGSTHLDVKYRV